MSDEGKSVQLTSLALWRLRHYVHHQTTWNGLQLGLVDTGSRQQHINRLSGVPQTHFLKSERILRSSSLLSLSLSCL